MIVPRIQPISSTVHFHERARESRVCGQGRLSIACEIQDLIMDVTSAIVRRSYTVVEWGHFGESNAPGSDSGEWKNEAQCIILTARARQKETDLAIFV